VSSKLIQNLRPLSPSELTSATNMVSRTSMIQDETPHISHNSRDGEATTSHSRRRSARRRPGVKRRRRRRRGTRKRRRRRRKGRMRRRSSAVSLDPSWQRVSQQIPDRHAVAPEPILDPVGARRCLRRHAPPAVRRSVSVAYLLCLAWPINHITSHMHIYLQNIDYRAGFAFPRL
jgi:hypothetical protein